MSHNHNKNYLKNYFTENVNNNTQRDDLLLGKILFPVLLNYDLAFSTHQFAVEVIIFNAINFRNGIFYEKFDQ